MKKVIGSLTVFLIASLFVLAEDAAYTKYSFARLNYAIGNIYIQRAQDSGYEEGIVNMPITEGDHLSTEEGRAEIYIGNSSYIRLDYNTELDFISLPRRDLNRTQIRIWSGRAYISVKDLFEDAPIEIHTPDISIYLLERGLYRLDVHENAETEIQVFQGMLEAAGESGSLLVKESQRIAAVRGHFISGPLRFMALAEDTFDRWNDYREVLISKRLARSYLPAELGDFEYELATYGEWVHIPPYGHVWVPGGLGSAWRPYHHGRWLWYPICGWTWLPYEPWGWVTSHYGRWHWRLGVGWYWIPTTHWGPGWVHWYADINYWGWAPLSYHDHPGVIINNIYYDRYPGSDYPHNSRALTIVTKSQLKAKDISKIAVRKESLEKESIRLSKKIPAGSAATTEVDISRLGDKKVYRTVKPSRNSLDSSEKSSSTERKISPVEMSTAPKTTERSVRSSDKKAIESTEKKNIAITKSSSESSRSPNRSKVSNSPAKSSSSSSSKSVRSTSDPKSSSKSSSKSTSKSTSSKKTTTAKARKKK